MSKTLTQGKPIGLIFSFALPVLIGLLFQQFYSVVDTALVGKLIGSHAVASVGSTGSIQFLVLGFCIGVCNGFAIPVAQRWGANDPQQMRNFVWNGLYLSVILSVVLALVTGFLSGTILTAMDTPADIYDGAYAYITIVFFGIPACFLYNLPAGIIRSLGDSKTPVYFLALASLVNIVLDIVLIGGFHTGVGGAAVATVFSQAASGVACILYMKKKFPVLKSTPEERRLNGRSCRTLCSIGIPMGLQYSITAIGSIVLQTAVNGLGSLYVTAVAVGSKICMFFFIPYDALGATMATYCGQNVGALKLDRLGTGIRSASLIGLIYSLIAMVVLQLSGGLLCLLFLDASETALIALVIKFIRMMSYFIFPLALVNIVRFSIQGMGFGRFAILAGVLEMIARLFFGTYMVPKFGFIAACLSSPAAWILADLFLIPGAAHCINQLRQRYPTTTE